MATPMLRQRHVAEKGDHELSADDVKTTAESWNDDKIKPSSGKADGFDLRTFFRENGDWAFPVLLTLASFWTRYYSIGRADFVVWDEAHFGKFGSHYLKRYFYFDVHPPLGKILVGFSGLLAGYDGSYSFPSGEKYPDNLNYTVMRVFLATFGAFLVPLAYGTAHELGYPRRAALLAGLMVLFENALLTISRFILLDSMLLFFTALSIYSLSGFHNHRNSPFSLDWWLWMVFTGISIGMVSSVKWVGLFSVALVGLYTIVDLFDKLGDLSMSKITYAKHWGARIICLIAIPLIVYMLSFALHFAILTRSGDGDAQMSSLFQATLEGNDLLDNPLELAYGSKFTLKNTAFGGGLLHSHVQNFPGGSMQQQVTCYHHKDENNHWVILRAWEDTKERQKAGIDDFDDEKVTYIKNGDIVRLVHSETKRNLHSHRVEAPVTKSAWEVSGYGNTTFGDENDVWLVEIVDDVYVPKPERIRSLTTRFRLVHLNLGCYLRSHNTQLPPWGFKQAEVVCDRHSSADDPHNIWNVEWHRHSRMSPADASQFKTSFLRDFIHLNVAMWTSNNALTPDETRDDAGTSKAWQWPFMLIGMRMCGWGDNSIKFYLLGNPAVWMTSAVAVLVIAALVVIYDARRRRYGSRGWRKGEYEHFLYVAFMIVGAWSLHYVPFFIMGRVLYLHHYLPALYISTLSIPFLLEHFLSHKSVKVRNQVFLVAGTIVALVFIYFSPISFGFAYPSHELSGRAWLSTWNLYDPLQG